MGGPKTMNNYVLIDRRTKYLAMLIICAAIFPPATGLGKFAVPVAAQARVENSTRDAEVAKHTEAERLLRERHARKSAAEEQILSQMRQMISDSVRKGGRFSMQGQVEIGHNTTYSMNGEDFEVDPNAIISGRLRAGVRADVEGPLLPNGRKIATSVIVNDDPDPPYDGRQIDPHSEK